MNESKGKASGLLAMTVVVTIYGVSYISRAVISEYLSTIAIVGVQMGIMTVLFFLYNLITKKDMKVNKKDIPMIVISGLFGTTFFHGLTILSITEIGATVSSLLYGFAAVFALLIEIALFHRPKTKLGIGSVVKDFAAEYLEDGRLFELRFNKIIPKRQICVVRNGRTPVSHAAEEFLRTVT